VRRGPPGDSSDSQGAADLAQKMPAVPAPAIDFDQTRAGQGQ